MRIEPEIGGIAIVLLGNFNPTIFSPRWFSRLDIISEAEAEEAEIGVIHPDVVMLRLGSKNIHVEQGRFQIESNEAPWVSSLDFISKTFGECLVHTPISAFGINRLVHFKVRSEDDRIRLGRALAPTSPWGQWGSELDARPRELTSGMIDLSMREMWKGDGWSGYTQATIQPSTILTGAAGVYMRINNHNTPDELEVGEGAERLIRYLVEKFDDTVARSEMIIDEIMRLAEEI